MARKISRKSSSKTVSKTSRAKTARSPRSTVGRKSATSPRRASESPVLQRARRAGTRMTSAVRGATTAGRRKATSSKGMRSQKAA